VSFTVLATETSTAEPQQRTGASGQVAGASEASFVLRQFSYIPRIIGPRSLYASRERPQLFALCTLQDHNAPNGYTPKQKRQKNQYEFDHGFPLHKDDDAG
jgi:hypothetical protein